MTFSPESDKGWQTFLKGLETNNACLIEQGLNQLAHAALQAAQPQPKESPHG